MPREEPGSSCPGRHFTQPADYLVRPGLVVLQIALAEERQQHGLAAEGLCRIDAARHPFDRARIALVGNVVELADGERGDGHAFGAGCGLVALPDLGLAQMHAIGDRAEGDLDAIKAKLFRDRQRGGILIRPGTSYTRRS